MAGDRGYRLAGGCFDFDQPNTESEGAVEVFACDSAQFPADASSYELD
jgi:hypothetical protein